MGKRPRESQRASSVCPKLKRRQLSEKHSRYPLSIRIPQSTFVPNNPHRPQSTIYRRTFKVVVYQKRRHQFPRLRTHLGPDPIAKVHVSVDNALLNYTLAFLGDRCGFALGLTRVLRCAVGLKPRVLLGRCNAGRGPPGFAGGSP